MTPVTPIRRSLVAGALASLVLSLQPAAQSIDIPPGVTVTIDPSFTLLLATNGDLVPVVEGRLHLDELTIGDGATILVRGPSPLRIVTEGDLSIYGHLDASGFDANDVGGIGTAVFPEPGAFGNAGGGRGGSASIQQSMSTAAGGPGSDGFHHSAGGRGGESGYGGDPAIPPFFGAQNSDPAFRRGAGGGGGAFGPDASGTTPPALAGVGLVAEDGAPGSSLASGALGSATPAGGLAGRIPFRDARSDNDFWGVAYDRVTGELVRGELPGLTGGAGGGGGGDSVRSFVFPHPTFRAVTDDKGGGGGGGAGAIHLYAKGCLSLVNPVTGAQGRITANGGDGANGQLVVFAGNFFVKSGGGGGGGSGGHLVLESAKSIDLGSGIGVLEARGGPGGQATQADGAGRGGDGGPGVIQLHAPGGHLNIHSGVPLEEAAVPEPKVLLPRTAANRVGALSVGG